MVRQKFNQKYFTFHMVLKPTLFFEKAVIAYAQCGNIMQKFWMHELVKRNIALNRALIRFSCGDEPCFVLRHMYLYLVFVVRFCVRNHVTTLQVYFYGSITLCSTLVDFLIRVLDCHPMGDTLYIFKFTVSKKKVRLISMILI